MASGFDFEDEVRRVARELWPSAEFGGATKEGGQERDGLFETEWVIHLLESTISRSKAKAEEDVSKLTKWRKRLASRGKPVQCWFITQSEPTADQRSVAPNDGSVYVLSFDQFRMKLVDAHGYLRSREKYAFGSARDSESGSTSIQEPYLNLDLYSASETLTATDVAIRVAGGGRVVLLADYGAGKSMTMREIFKRMSTQFARGESTTFPIHINLRDHHGQVEPAEALERHSRLIGFSDPSQLVRAWRAGYACLLLDGFDEMATPGWIGPIAHMRDLRRRSVELVRRFVKDTPIESGVVLAGRQHYFDSRPEMANALLGGRPFNQYEVAEFSEEQVGAYLQSHGWTLGLPDWLPARPLLLSYLVRRELLAEALAIPAGTSAASAWDSLLGLVSDREADLEANVDGHTVRSIVESLASLARTRGWTGTD